jgi:hypothetical protein
MRRAAVVAVLSRGLVMSTLKHVLHVIIRPATAQKLVGTVIINPGQRRTEAVVTIELGRLADVGMLC